MNGFDKFCSCLAIPIGGFFMLLGVFGVFAGSQAQFTLPPVAGGLPFFLGWAMCVTLIKFWRSSLPPDSEDHTESIDSTVSDPETS